MDIKNIYCVGRNYVNHAKELGNEVPEHPMIFIKPTHSIGKADGSLITLPKEQGDIHYELELVLYIGKEVQPNFHVNDIVTQMALGIDFTLRDVQSKLKERGHPWLLAKGFPNAAVLTDFWEFRGAVVTEKEPFILLKNDEIVQSGYASSMIFNFQTLLDYIYNTCGLSKGDIVFTGTPEGVGPVSHGDELIMKWGQQEKGRFSIEI